MKYIPHEYQAYATRFILEHPEAAILLQMGLGKSVIALTAAKTLLEQGRVRKVLVIAPLRVARDTWPEEIRKWDHLKGIRYAVAVGTAAERRAALEADAQLFIINRENLSWLAEESGLPFDYDMVIVDELSSFRNPQAKRFRSLLRVWPRVSRIVGLTCTPTGNGLMDLYAEFRVLDMGKRLGRFFYRFRETYFVPERYSGNRVYTWKPRPGAEAEITGKIADITVSMKSADYLRMPQLVFNRTVVRMSREERAACDTMKEQLMLRLPRPGGGEQVIDAKNAAALAGKLCQMAGGAVYTETGETAVIHERKLEALEDMAEAAAGHPMLVACWYRHEAERIRNRFPGAREIRTAADIRDWNAGKIAIGVIHPASAGHGLNLQQGGSTLVWFGLTWSLEMYQQTNARLWRQGQRADTVVIAHIVTEGTMDEKILDALERKDRTQQAVINAVKAVMKGE